MIYLAYIISVIFVILVFLFLKQKNLISKMIVLSLLTNVGLLFIILLGSQPYYESYLDIAIIYILLGFIVNKSILQTIIMRKK